MEVLIIKKESEESVGERVALARKLGHKEVLLLFTKDDDKNLLLAERLGARAGLLVKTTEFLRKKARGMACGKARSIREADKNGEADKKRGKIGKRAGEGVANKGLYGQNINKYDEIAAPAKREFFEDPRVTIIFEPERGSRGDFIHHRNSGLHQVLLKLCQPSKRRKGKRIVTTTRLLLDSKSPALILGRMMQNARWCRKYKVPYLITSGAQNRWEQRDKSCIEALARELKN